MYEMIFAAIEKQHTMCVCSFFLPLNLHLCSFGILGLKHLAFDMENTHGSWQEVHIY